MTQDQKSELFLQFKPMVASLANKFSRGNEARYRELCDVGESALGLAITRWAGDDDHYGDKWKSGRVTPLTWVYHILRWEMLSYIRKTDRHPVAPISENVARQMSKPTPWLQRMLSNLGDDARTIVSLIVMAPAELMDEMKLITVRRARKALRQYLAEHCEWDDQRIELAWNEVAVELGS